MTEKRRFAREEVIYGNAVNLNEAGSVGSYCLPLIVTARCEGFCPDLGG